MHPLIHPWEGSCRLKMIPLGKAEKSFSQIVHTFFSSSQLCTAAFPICARRPASISLKFLEKKTKEFCFFITRHSKSMRLAGKSMRNVQNRSSNLRPIPFSQDVNPERENRKKKKVHVLRNRVYFDDSTHSLKNSRRNSWRRTLEKSFSAFQWPLLNTTQGGNFSCPFPQPTVDWLHTDFLAWDGGLKWGARRKNFCKKVHSNSDGLRISYALVQRGQIGELIWKW